MEMFKDDGVPASKRAHPDNMFMFTDDMSHDQMVAMIQDFRVRKVWPHPKTVNQWRMDHGMPDAFSK
jgi:hypothetical protein